MRYLEGHDGIVTSIAFAPNGFTLTSVAMRGPASFWNLADADPPRAFPDPSSSVVVEGFTRVAWSQEADVLALGRDNGVVMVVAPSSGKMLAQIDNQIMAPVTGLTFFNNGRHLVISCGGDDDGVGAIHLAERDKQFRINKGTFSGSAYGAVAATPRGKICYYVDSKRRVFRWDLVSPDKRQTNNFGKPIRALALSPDATAFAATDDYAIQIYNADTMQRLQTLNGHQGRVDALAFT